MVMGSSVSPSSVRRSGSISFDSLFNIIDEIDNQLDLLLEANTLRTDGRTNYEAPTQEPAPASNGCANIEAPTLQPATPTIVTEIDKENDNDENEGDNDKEKKRTDAPTPEDNTKSPNKDDNEESPNEPKLEAPTRAYTVRPFSDRNQPIPGPDGNPTDTTSTVESPADPLQAVQQPIAASNRISMPSSIAPTFNTSIPRSIPNSYTASTDPVHTVHPLRHLSCTLQLIYPPLRKNFATSDFTPIPKSTAPTGQCNGPGIFAPTYITPTSLRQFPTYIQCS